MWLGVKRLGYISGPKPLCPDKIRVGLDLEGLEAFESRGIIQY